MALKWGFAGGSKIAHDYMNALETLPAGQHEVVAIAEPMLVDQAKALCKQFNVPKCYSTFLELAQDPNVEIVHIGVLNPYHYEVSMLMLEHQKHVLCQKPLCMNEKQARKLIEFAEKKKVFFTEGVWSRSFPSYHYMREQIQSGKLGDIQTVVVEFGNPNVADRGIKKALGGGTILDLGVYTIQFCQFVFKDAPISIKASGKLNDDGVDVEVTAELRYSGNRVAKMKTSFLELIETDTKIIGTNGTMIVPDFSCPTSVIDIDESVKLWPLPKAKYEFNFPINSCGLRYEADEVRKCIRAGKLEKDTISHEDSIIIAHIQTEIRKQIGVKYPADDED